MRPKRLDSPRWLVGLLLVCFVPACDSPPAEHAGHAGHEGHLKSEAHPAATHNHSGSSGAHGVDSAFTRSVNRYVISDQKLITPVTTTAGDSIPVTGYLTFDPRRNRQISARVDGRIERLYYRYNYQPVARGARLLDLYSPELRTALEEYAYLTRTGADATLAAQSRQRLLRLGLTPAQLQRPDAGAATVPLLSPYAGFLVPTAPPIPSGSMSAATPSGVMPGNADVAMGGMGDAPAAPMPTQQRSAASPAGVREGGYVAAGDVLFQVNDLRTVWAVLAVDSRYLPVLRPGLPVILARELAPEEPLRGQVGLVEPAYESGQKFLQVRVYLPNPAGTLKLNELVRGYIAGGRQSGMRVPLSSIYDLGHRRIAWALRGHTPAGHKVLEARTVRIGARHGNEVEILSGLKPDDQIAEQAGLLTDPESCIETAP